MEIFPNSSTCLELTIAIPGLSSSSVSLHSYAHGGGGVGMKELDINQVPSSRTESEECVDLEDESSNHQLGPTRKKLRLTREQSRILDESFRHNHTLNPKQKETLAEQLKLKQRQVEVWFQNRRARNKLKQTEMECEYLKRWFGSLTEQNKKLQKEVDELRAMKAGPTARGPNQTSGSTLTMCPRCERVGATGPGEMGTTNTKATN